MAQFSVNTHRLDPYKNFKFRVRWDGKVVAGISKVGALKRSTEAVPHREGNGPSFEIQGIGKTKFEAISLERGITFDPDFQAWAEKVWNPQGDGGVSLKDARKDIIIEMLNLQGTVVRAYTVYRCWVSEYTAMPELDASANAIAIESITLQNEGWERMDVPEVLET